MLEKYMKNFVASSGKFRKYEYYGRTKTFDENFTRIMDKILKTSGKFKKIWKNVDAILKKYFKKFSSLLFQIEFCFCRHF